MRAPLFARKVGRSIDLVLLLLLLLPVRALAAPTQALITGTMYKPGGAVCGGCSLTVRTPYTQSVDGGSFPGGSQSSWKTDADGELPADAYSWQGLWVEITQQYADPCTVQIPASSSVTLATLNSSCASPPLGGSNADMTAVWTCSSGDCSDLVAGGGDTLDATAADSTAPCKDGTSTPATCSVGECFFDTNATAGENLSICTSTDTWTQISGGGGSGNSFETMNVPSGTDPVADSSTDTLNFTASGIVSISGDSTTDTITIGATEVGDVSSVGDCTTGACFTGTTGSTLTGASGTSLIVNTDNNIYLSFDTDNNATSTGVVIGSNASGASATPYVVVSDAATPNVTLRNATRLRFNDTSDDTNYVELVGPSGISSNFTFTLPSDDGTSNQFLQTNGSGVLTWATPSGSGNVNNTGTPVNNQIAVWTNSTTIEGDPKLTLSGSSLTLGDSAVDAGFTLATGLTGGTDPQIDFTNGQVDCANCRFTLTGGTEVIPDAGGGGVATRVPYWSDTDTLTDEAAFAYDSSTNTLTVTNVTGNASTASTASDLSNAGIDAVLPDIDGFGLSINTGTTPDELQLAPGEVTGPQVWGDGSGTMSWTFNTGITDPIIDFYNTGVVDVTGTLQMNTVPVVTTTGTQTLTNKTLTTPTIASFTNATHNHTNAAGGGTLTLAGSAFPNQGTTTTVLHGNAAGNPSWGQVSNSDLAGSISVSKTLLTDGAGILLSTDTLSTASTEANFLANAASVTCSSSPGKLIVDTTAETLAYCDGAVGSTQKWAALGNDSGESTAAANNSVALTTDTTGNYAAGDAEAGNATGLACTTCVDATDIATGAVTSAKILDGEIANADVNASAAILFSKLATTNTDKLLGRDTAGGGAVEEIGLTSPLAFTGASAVQIGDVTDCSANQYVNAVGANLALSCAQPDHGNLAGLADDDHTQYWLLAGRTGSQAAILSTNNNGTVTLANSGGAGSGTGTIYGSGKTGENLKLQPNSANTTTGSVKVDGYLDFWPSIATNSSQVNVAGFSPTVTLSDGGGYSLIDSNPTLSIPDWSAIQIFRARGSIDRTGTTGGTLYQYTGFHMGTTFTSSTTGGPLFQDAFFDASVINQVANTATQNTYQPISFLSKPTYKASSGATLTIGQTTGVDINPSWGVGGGGTLTNTTFSAFKLHTPNEIGGTLSLPTYIALDVEDLDTAGVTTPLSLRSVGTTTEMRHAGAARFGATGAPTTGKDLDVQGDVLITGTLDVGDAVADLGASSTTTIVDINDTINTPNSTGSLVGFGFNVISAQSESNNIIALDVQPTITQSGTSEVPMFYGLNIAGTTTATTANFPVAALLRHVRTYTSATANATPMSSLITLMNGPVVSNTATSGTTTVGTVESLYHNPTLSLNDTDGATSGVTAMTLTNDIAVEVAGTYTETSGTLTVTNRTGLKYSDVTNTGSNTAITNNVGVDIAALSTATTNIGIRNADTTVYTPCSQTSLTSGFTISPDCTVIEIGTSGNNNYTSSTSTGISAGVAGQILTLINVDSNSNTITMDNTGGTIELAGAADYAMGINDTLTLVYSATRSLWLETARSDN